MGERASSHDMKKLGLVGTAAMFLAGCLGVPKSVTQIELTQGGTTPECNVTDVYSAVNSTPDKSVPANDTDKKIGINIKTVGISDDTKVRLALNPPDSDRFIVLGITTLGFIPNVFEVSGNRVITELGKIDGEFLKEGEQETFTPGSYDLAVLPQTGDIYSAYCTSTNAFEVIKASEG